jgi:hypothetical protein
LAAGTLHAREQAAAAATRALARVQHTMLYGYAVGALTVAVAAAALALSGRSHHVPGSAATRRLVRGGLGVLYIWLLAAISIGSYITAP